MNKQPLAYRMSPKTLDSFVGQLHIVGEGRLLRRIIEADKIQSVIFYGPPGTGKTALARIIANMTQSRFISMNAVNCGVQDIKRIAEENANLFLNPKGRTVLFLDEIHRFNKAQQDTMLPHLEDGTIVLIGATTENPFFEINKAILSRSTIFKLEPLTKENIISILKQAISDKENGYGNYALDISQVALQALAEASSGDARIALNALELAVITSKPDQSGVITITKDILKECIQHKSIRFDKDGEEHYDNISAFIKSMRGSSADGAVFYLAKALVAGEDINFLARRIVICAAEDVGLANPQALVTAQAAASAVRMIGMPEASIILSEAAVYVALSPKSNSTYTAIMQAMHDVKEIETGEIPLWLRNAPIQGMKDQFNYSKGYKYAHNYSDGYVEQQYLPDKIKDKQYYTPTDIGLEGKINEWINQKKKS